MEDRKKRLLISQELFFAKTLAGNDKTKRDRALKKLNKWLHARTHEGGCGFSKEDYMRIWKGLFYCMWMSDKPLVQEEVAENISKLVHSVGDGGALFIKCFFLTMIHEWNGIDQHRLDKFQMLVRRFLRQAFEWSRKCGWSASALSLCSAFVETILKPTGSQEGIPVGLLLHFSDVYVEELTKAVDEKLQPPESDVVIQFLRPFACLLARNDDPRVVRTVVETVFNHLMRQSDVGLDYEELRRKGWHMRKDDKFEVDKEGSDNEETNQDVENEEGENDNNEEEEEEGVLKVKDPRAGGVNVVLPQLDVDFADLSSMLMDEARDPSLRPKQKRRVEALANKFTSITRGNYPLQVGRIPSKLHWKKGEQKKAVKRAVTDLFKHEERLFMKELSAESEGIPKKKKKMMNGQLPKTEPEKTKIGRIRKRGKRKSKAERRAAKRKAAENGIDAGVEGGKKSGGAVAGEGVRSGNGAVEGFKRVVKEEGTPAERIAEREGRVREEVPSLPRKRCSLGDGWLVCKLDSPSRPTQSRSSVGGGEWLVETSLGKKESKVKNNPTTMIPKGVEDTENCEMELVIRKLRPNPFSPYGRKLMTPQLLKKMELEAACKSPSSDKKVKIVLSRNLSQGTQEYQKSLKASPAIPFDPSKVPSQGVLKATSSPILLNPFYRKSLRTMNLSPL